jgi:hypothetical protein
MYLIDLLNTLTLGVDTVACTSASKLCLAGCIGDSELGLAGMESGSGMSLMVAGSCEQHRMLEVWTLQYVNNEQGFLCVAGLESWIASAQEVDRH